MIVLDTSFLIDYFRDRELQSSLPEGEKATVTVISFYEIMAGIKRLRSKQEERFFQHFFGTVDILGVDTPSAEIASDITAKLSGLGIQVNAFDVLIAGTAIANRAGSIITADRDFEEIAKCADIDITFYSRRGND
jgi:predicted nucleic acid-binding protein